MFSNRKSRSYKDDTRNIEVAAEIEIVTVEVKVEVTEMTEEVGEVDTVEAGVEVEERVENIKRVDHAIEKVNLGRDMNQVLLSVANKICMCLLMTRISRRIHKFWVILYYYLFSNHIFGR